MPALQKDKNLIRDDLEGRLLAPKVLADYPTAMCFYIASIIAQTSFADSADF